MIYLFWNGFGFVAVFNVFLQCQIMSVSLGGTSLNSPNALTKKAFKDLQTMCMTIGIGLLVSPTSIIDDWLIGVDVLATSDEKSSLGHVNVNLLLTQMEGLLCI